MTGERTPLRDLAGALDTGETPEPAAAAPAAPASPAVKTELPAQNLAQLFREACADDDRSAMAFGAIKALQEAGYSAENILAAFAAHPESGAAQHYTSDEQLRADVERVCQKMPTEVAALNREFAVVLEQGEALIYRERELDGRRWFDVLTFESFRKWYRNQKVTIAAGNEQTKRRALGDYWLEHPQRRQYSDVVFRPDGAVPPGALNLWRGYGVEPKAGDWSLMRCHIRDVVCDSNPTLYRYVLAWLARLVQEPGSPGEVALVMRGGQGTGKGMFARWVCQLLGQHALHVGSPEHLVGQFNGHLRDASFVFCDEAFFAGDPKHKNKLKSLITEPRITVEQKFRQAVQVDNVLHLIMASNADWVVPAELDERRFCLLDVPTHRRNDFAYFQAIEDQMRDGGAAAMLHDLLGENLAGFNVRALPHTSGLVDQKLRSLQGPHRWLADRLHSGRIGARDWTESGVEIEKDGAYVDYERWSDSKRSRDYQTADRATWSRNVREMLPGALREYRPRASKEGRRPRFWQLAPLAEARDAFAGVLGGAVRWDDADETGDEISGAGHDIFS